MSITVEPKARVDIPGRDQAVANGGAGRYAPSPSGELHVGNLRTLILAYLIARRSGLRFLWRVEDLDRVKDGAAEQQIQQAQELGVQIDPPLVRQSERGELYAAAIAELSGQGLVYECYCSRKDILNAPTAPHSPPGAYPGTCRDLTEEERQAPRARLLEQGRMPALRLRTDPVEVTVADRIMGPVTARLDDVVLRRTDGVVAYNLAVVVDDALTGVTQVVRGDDLALSAPRQAHLAGLLGYSAPEYWHVPLVLGASGQRLAKRDGAITLSQLQAQDFDLWGWMGRSLGFGPWRSIDDALTEFDAELMNRQPVVFAS